MASLGVAGCGGLILGLPDVDAIVFLTCLRRAESRVGFGDADEAFGGVGVSGVEVRVVSFGEFVELLLDLGWGGGSGEVEGQVVGRSVIVEACGAVEGSSC